MSSMYAQKILSLAINLELKTSECYERIGKMPGAEPFADDLAKLAKEEIVHANLLRSGKSYESSDPDAFRVLIPLEQLEKGLAAAGEFIADIDAGKMTLAEAVGRIRDLEIGFEQAHLSTLLEIEDPGLRKLFQALSIQDAGHQVRLQNIIRDLQI
jgi:rubrerythrin